MTRSYSQSLLQLAAAAFQPPETTMPWVVVNGLGNAGSGEAYIETTCYENGKDVAHNLSGSRVPILSIQCFTVVDRKWVSRSVHEVPIGRLGEAAVAVFRDDAGIDFCPDAPEQPVSQLTDLMLCGVIEDVQPANRMPPTASYGDLLYKAIKRHVSARQAEQLNGVEPATGP